MFVEGVRRSVEGASPALRFVLLWSCGDDGGFCIRPSVKLEINEMHLTVSSRAGLHCKSRVFARLSEVWRHLSCTERSADRKTSCDAGALLDRYYHWLVRCYLYLEKRGATGPLLLERCPDERLRPKESTRGVRNLYGLDNRDEEQAAFQACSRRESARDSGRCGCGLRTAKQFH